MKEIDLIPYRQKNRISKEKLAKELKTSVDKINPIISQLRKQYVILSDTKVGGYWRPDTKEELLEFIREHNSRQFAESGLIQMAWNEIDKLN
jgi:biotin operon repressor